MKVWIVITGFAFTIGNIIYDRFGMFEPKLFWVPLSIFILLLVMQVKKHTEERHKSMHLLLAYFIMLAWGNVGKQVAYSEKIKLINDYYWCAFVTVWLFYRLFKPFWQATFMEIVIRPAKWTAKKIKNVFRWVIQK